MGFRVMEGNGEMRVNKWVVNMSKIVKEYTNKGVFEKMYTFWSDNGNQFSI